MLRVQGGKVLAGCCGAQRDVGFCRRSKQGGLPRGGDRALSYEG